MEKIYCSCTAEDIETILGEFKLISEFTIQKKYPDTININLKEVNFVAKLIKDKKKYFLADNNNLIPFKDYVTRPRFAKYLWKRCRILFQ